MLELATGIWLPPVDGEGDCSAAEFPTENLGSEDDGTEPLVALVIEARPPIDEEGDWPTPEFPTGKLFPKMVLLYPYLC
jgi:hypothetical protein